MNAPLPSQVIVTAPARLHLGFVDLNPPTGRRFGSLGLALSAPCCRVRGFHGTLAQRDTSVAQAKALQHVAALRSAYAFSPEISAEVIESIPVHCGLGSGTQLGMAVGTAISRIAGLNLSAADMRQQLARGARSGIGIGAFAQGGFLVDGGHGATTNLPPITSRVVFPDHWRVLLIFDEAFQGLSGAKEAAAFCNLPSFPETLSAHLCRLVMTRILPGLAEANMAEFGPAITEVQRLVGDHFAPAQGGRFASTAVANALAWLEARGAQCVGQSSWGPTGFAMLESAQQAQQFAQEAAAKYPALRLVVASGRNEPADIQLEYADRAGATILPLARR